MTGRLTTFFCGICRKLTPEYDLKMGKTVDALVCSKCLKKEAKSG